MSGSTKQELPPHVAALLRPPPVPVEDLPQLPDEGEDGVPRPAGLPAPIADHAAGYVRYRCGRCGALVRDPNRTPVEHDEAYCDRVVAETERRFAEQEAGDRRPFWERPW